MVRKLTITVDEDVYEGLRAKVGPRRISRFLNDLAKPLVTEDALMAGYRAMAADGVRETEAADWADALIGDATRLDGRGASTWRGLVGGLRHFDRRRDPQDEAGGHRFQ